MSLRLEELPKLAFNFYKSSCIKVCEVKLELGQNVTTQLDKHTRDRSTFRNKSAGYWHQHGPPSGYPSSTAQIFLFKQRLTH